MPTYLIHGFRWQRRSIRVYIIMQNVDDASPEWIIREQSATALLESFYGLFDFMPPSAPGQQQHQPSGGRGGTSGSSTGGGGARSRSRSGSRTRDAAATAAAAAARNRSRSESLSKPVPPLPGSAAQQPQQQQQQPPPEDDPVTTQDWSPVKLLEEYDPLDLTSVSRPYAYVADYAVRVDLSVDVAQHIARYEERQQQGRGREGRKGRESKEEKRRDGKGSGGDAATAGRASGWFEKLRDELQSDEELRWYVVVNGDEARDFPEEVERRPAVPAKAPPIRVAPDGGVPGVTAAAVLAASGTPEKDRSKTGAVGVTYRPFPKRPARSRSHSRENHVLYVMQQGKFEKSDREKEAKAALPPPPGPPALGVGSVAQRYQRHIQQRKQKSQEQKQQLQQYNYRGRSPPDVLDKELPTLGSKSSKAGGLRRLFARKKSEVAPEG